MNPLRRILQSTALAGLFALCGVAGAQTQGYAQKTKTIRAAVVLLDSDKPLTTSPLGRPYEYGQTAAPYAFYNLDQAEGIKPDGWTFINPNAPGETTKDIALRFQELGDPEAPPDPTDPSVVDNAPRAVSKRNAAYWTVNLSKLSETQAADYDVLLIAPRNGLQLNSFERERLRRFVDGGGVLWVDLLGATANTSWEYNLPFGVQRVTGTTGSNQDASSPLIDGLRRVTSSDLISLNPGDLVVQAVAAANGINLPSLVGEFGRYRSVVTDLNGRPTIVEASLGDGKIVVTARGAAAMLNRGSAQALLGNVGTANVGYRAVDSPRLNAQGRAAARLAVNIVALGGGYNQPSGGSRKLGSAALDPGAPVLSRFKAEGTFGPDNLIGSGVPIGSPVIYKGYFIATVRDGTSSNYRVVVLDAMPGRDLDGDGDEDDGIDDRTAVAHDAWRDTSVGKPMDVVWISDVFTNRLSSPVCAEVPEARGTIPVDQILVTDATGTLYAFALTERNNATQRVVGGVHKIAYPAIAPPDNQPAVYTGNDSVNPPTVYDGLAYIADVSGSGPVAGRVWVANLATGAQLMTVANKPWYVGGAGVAGTAMPLFTASPTIGYIPIQDSSGGLDRVLYAPGITNNTSQPAFASLWLGAKGEKPYQIEVTAGTPGTVKITTRAGSNGQLPIFLGTGAGDVERRLQPQVSISDQTGNPRILSDWLTGPATQNAPGELTFQTSRTQAEFDNINLRVDYSIDWGVDPANLSGQIVRGRLILPVKKFPEVDKTQRILGPIALTARGTLHMTQGSVGLSADDPTPTKAGGTYWAIREDAGRGSFRVVSRYTLYQNYNQSFAASAASTPVAQVLSDVDGIQQFLPGYDVNTDPQGLRVFKDFRFAGGVALRNGVAFAAVNAKRGNLGIPVAMVLAFKAEPETPELRLGTSLGDNPRLAQADMQRSDPGAIVRQATTSTLAGPQLVVDSENGVIRVENLATVNREEITDSISLSQPVGVSSAGRTFTLRQPEAFGDRWSPLLWFSLWNGAIAKGAPLVAGNEVFIAADTLLIEFLNNNPSPNFGNTNGVVWSVDADAPTTGAYAMPLPGRPWNVQQVQVLRPDANTFDASPYFRMPQNRGARGIEDWVIRLNQTALGTSKLAYGVAGGDGVVAAWGDRGLYGMSRAEFIVCDEGRLLRVDSSGNPVSKAFGGRFTGVGGGGGAAEFRPLVRPVKAYPVGNNDFLVVDAGGNRVVRMDADGNEQRSIDRILLDPKYKPTNYRVNEPLTFKDPRDVATYEGYVYKGAGEVVDQQRALEYWIRYIVADAGNGRIVELVDRFEADATTGRVGAPVTINQKDPETGASLDVAQVGVLIWQSPSLESAAKTGDYYHSISRVFIGNVGSGANPGRYVYVAGVGRTRPTRASAGLDNPNLAARPSGSGGAIVIFDPEGGTRVFDRFGMPNLSATKFYNPQSSGLTYFDKFDINTPASRPRQDNRPFTGLTAVTAATTIQNGAASIRIMASDVDAVYEFVVSSAILADPKFDPTRNAPDSTSDLSSLEPVWMINEAAFTALRADIGTNPKFFRPAYARRLDSGDVVIVNGYRGLTRNGQSEYFGEVALMDGLKDFGKAKDNLGFSLSSVLFGLPPLTGIRGLVSPVFADRR